MSIRYKIEELKNKDKSELLELLSEGKNKILEIKMKKAVAVSKNVKELREIRKNIARVLTVLNGSSK